MAESLREKVSGNMLSLECAVCLQTCVHPAELPCGHIFCYLCIKGIVNQGRRCAMCRQDIPLDYLDKPRLLKPVDTENSSQGFEDGHLWFYEGHNGWWQYDERTSLELESAYQKGERCCELLIAGFLYIADFDSMLQYRRNDPNRRRRIKRDLATITIKGVAGLKALKNNSTSLHNPDLVSTPDLPGLPVSGQSITDNVHNNALFADLSIVGSNSVETSQNDQISRMRNSQVSSNYTCNTNLSDNTSSNAQAESNHTFYSRNFEIDDMIHNTLDWTIQQIESLNLELSNDYENLFRDVNNYGQLQNILNRRRSHRLENDPFNQFSTSVSRINWSPDNELESSDETFTLPNMNQTEGNMSLFRQNQNLPEHVHSTFINSRNRLSSRPAFLSGSHVSRDRLSQMRARRVSSRNSSARQDEETLF